MNKETIAVVSGLPRSGTSMMMRMLEAGGLEVLTDDIRTADKDNPKGYYEFERVKQLDHDTEWLEDAKGRVVKIISQLLQELPADCRYRVVFMHRAMDEILASQRRMLVRRGEPTDKISDEQIAALFRKHLERVENWLEQQSNFDVIHVSYNEVLAHPRKETKRVSSFFDHELDIGAMMKVVDPTLYRQRYQDQALTPKTIGSPGILNGPGGAVWHRGAETP